MNDQLARGLPPIDDEYQGPSWWHFSRLADARHNPGMRRIAALGVVVLAVSMATGVLNVDLGLERHSPADRPARRPGHDLSPVRPEPARRGLAGAHLGAGARVRREPRERRWLAGCAPDGAPLRPGRGPRDADLLGLDGHAQHQPRAAALARPRPLLPRLPHRAHHRLAGRAHLEHRARLEPGGRLPGLEGLGVRRHPAGAARRGPAPPLRRAAGAPLDRPAVRHPAPLRGDLHPGRAHRRGHLQPHRGAGLRGHLHAPGVARPRRHRAHPERRAARPAPARDADLPRSPGGGAHGGGERLLDRPRPDGGAPAQPLPAREPHRLLQPARLLRAVPARGGARPPPGPGRRHRLPGHRPLQAHQRPLWPRDGRPRAAAALRPPARHHPGDRPPLPLGRGGVRDPDAAHGAGGGAGPRRAHPRRGGRAALRGHRVPPRGGRSR